MLIVTCDAVVELVGRCAECLPYLISLADFGLLMTLHSSSSSFMAVLMIAVSLSLVLIIYLFICSFLFTCRLMAALTLNFISVLVVWSI